MVTSSPAQGDDLAEAVPDLDAARDATMRAVLDRLVVVRLAFVPILLTIQAAICAGSPEPWRVALAAALSAGMLGLFAVEFWRVRAGRAGRAALPANVALMLALQLGVVVASGGIHSPLLLVLPVMALQTTLVFGPGGSVSLVVGPHLAVLGALTLAEARTGWSPAIVPVATSFGWLLAQLGALALVEAVAVALGAVVRSIVGRAVADVVAAHDNERRAHAEHARELSALTGEIAHELKNPLASVKGLAALLARDAEGRSAERLSVLREEVDRMQGTLETFLDLSRPLVPLAREEVDLAALAADVGRLCEGLLCARDVALRVEGQGSARADRSKLRQVLVNLVQNAIEAAPPGSSVEVRAAPGQVEVLDRGPGVPPELGARVFEPGVTTRPRGHGLGLAIARGLVGQHGGELTLAPRAGGGTAARVVLRGAT
jgi:two-component system sensor histidine kinase HydH